MTALLALEKCGLCQQLTATGQLDIKEADSVDQDVLMSVCAYLSEVAVLRPVTNTKFVVRNPRRFSYLVETMYACYAYHRPAEALDRILSGTASYGRDVTRDDYYDGLASATLTSTFSFRYTLPALRVIAPTRLVDVGCGTGQYLHFLSGHFPDVELVGLDVCGASIREGDARGFSRGKVRLMVGDLFEMDRVAAAVGPADVLSFMFVLHELDDDAVVAVGSRVRSLFPAASILLTELTERGSIAALRRRTPFAELELAHGISGQVLRSVNDWLGLMEDAGYQCTRRNTNGLTRQSVMLFAPAAS